MQNPANNTAPYGQPYFLSHTQYSLLNCPVPHFLECSLYSVTPIYIQTYRNLVIQKFSRGQTPGSSIQREATSNTPGVGISEGEGKKEWHMLERAVVVNGMVEKKQVW